MGLKYNTYLDGNKIYGCHKCHAHLADHEEILSRVGPVCLRPVNPNTHSGNAPSP